MRQFLRVWALVLLLPVLVAGSGCTGSKLSNRKVKSLGEQYILLLAAGDADGLDQLGRPNTDIDVSTERVEMLGDVTEEDIISVDLESKEEDAPLGTLGEPPEGYESVRAIYRVETQGAGARLVQLQIVAYSEGIISIGTADMLGFADD